MTPGTEQHDPPPPGPGTPRTPAVPEDIPLPAPLPPPTDFLAAAAALNIAFEGDDLSRLGRFLALLLEANRSFNLTAVDDPAKAWTRHILDSLTLVPLLAELPEGSSVIDVGSGGGLPGIPLAICLPGLRFTLLEATGKKAAFLARAVAALGLAGTRVIADRAERLGQQRTPRAGVRAGPEGHRERYDAVVARAVGRLTVIAELTVPLAKVGGRVLLIKGQQADAELSEAGAALGLLRVRHAGTLDTPTGRIVVLEKPEPTPHTYPRRDGEPARVPLGARAPARDARDRVGGA